MSQRCDALMIIGFGGPAAPEEVRPFLDRVLEGRPVPRERYEEVVHHYELLGGRSPYNELTMRQADQVRGALAASGIDAPVAAGFRNAPPFFDDALRDLDARGSRRALGFVLSAFQCEASWDRYLGEVAEARERAGAAAPLIEYPPPWHDDPLFIEAAADRVRAALALLRQDQREDAELIFTAHSIPLAMAARSPYVAQLYESAHLTADAIGRRSFTVAYQSRSGNPREPWLEPDVREILRGLGGRAAVVMPLGFLCDHVEVLHDLDIEAAQVAREAGIAMARAGAVGAHPKFIEMIARIARDRITGDRAPGKIRNHG
jgi:ferrochelatase